METDWQELVLEPLVRVLVEELEFSPLGLAVALLDTAIVVEAVGGTIVFPLCFGR